MFSYVIENNDQSIFLIGSFTTIDYTWELVNAAWSFSWKLHDTYWLSKIHDVTKITSNTRAMPRRIATFEL